MTAYDALKLVHVLAVITWVGGSLWLVLLVGRAARAGRVALAHTATLGGQAGGLFGASAGVALLAGVGMLLVDGPGWSWSAPWINVGFVVFLAGSILGSRVIGPGYERLGELAGGDAADADVEAARRRLVAPSMANLTLLVVAVAAMVFKWG